MVLTNDVIGYVASSFYIISLFPELYAVYVNRECKLSIYFLIFQIITTILFIVYDILLDIIPLLISDVTLLVELFFLVGFKLTCNGQERRIIKSSIV
tara:strand:+ start:1119 stop:1409 length:291 start_codon:yes stop_codon:yes gene_type:complete